MSQVHYTISGSFITKFAREKYQETNDLSKGVEVLCQILMDFPKDLATAVILGNKKIVGEEDMYVEDDCTEVVPFGFINTSSITDVLCGWIAPDGSVYGHKSYNEVNDHTALAERICERLDLTTFNPEHTLEDEGYIKFQPEKVLLGSRPATNAQKDVVAEFCLSHDAKISLGFYGNIYSGDDIRGMDLLMFNKHLRANGGDT